MLLPHLPPIKFVRRVISIGNGIASVECQFPYFPSLGMCLEASAQASSALAEKDSSGKIEGYLVGANNVELYKKPDKKVIVTKVTKIFEMQGSSLFSFEMEEYAKGKFAIYAQ